MIRAIFFDIDGTLLDGLNGISKSSIDCLYRLKQKGVKIVIATGRDINEIKNFGFFEIGFDAYLTLNGQLCYDKNLNLFFKNPIDKKDSMTLIDYFKRCEFPLSLYTEKDVYINCHSKDVEDMLKDFNCPVPLVDDYKNGLIYHAVAFGGLEIKELLEKNLKNCTITYWNELGMDILAKSGGKSVGIKEYLKMENIKIEETMAFGDSDNDVDMLKLVNIGVAMGNGLASVKEIADYVTADIKNDGIEKALRHFKLI